MLWFLNRNPRLGIELTSSAVRVAALSGYGGSLRISSAIQDDLPPGVLTESYSVLNIADPDRLTEAIKRCAGPALPKPCRASVCLPDQIFRIQTLEFDELPPKAVERDRLIRWRLEKTAAFDLTETVLRHQILRRGPGITVLACVAKKAVLDQYEDLFLGLDVEPWSVGISSLSALNFYAPYMNARSGSFALTHVNTDSFSTIIAEKGGVRFYRSKDLKRSGGDEIKARLLREIEDSLHFYSHRDRSQQSELGHLYLTGDARIGEVLEEELKSQNDLTVEALSPAVVLPGGAEAPTEMAAALGAGIAA